LMLGTVALLEQRRAVAASDDEVRRLATRIGDLEHRLARTESPVTEGVVATPVATTSGSAAVAPSPLTAETRRPAAVLPPRQRRVAIAPRPASPSDDFAARVRAGWDALKRGFREVGRDIRGGFSDQAR